MFLNRGGRSRLHALAEREEGVALAAVIALMALLLVISSVVATVTLRAASFSTSARADVQSVAAAQAGVDAVFATIQRGTYPCSATNASPAYSATVAYKDGNGATLTCSGSGLSTIPATASITSTGTASAKGLKATDGDTATAYGTVTVTSTTTQGTATGTGPAIYGYSQASGGFSGSGKVYSYNGSIPDVMFKTGDATCSGAAAANVTNFVVAAGSLTMSGSCNIAGNAYASGALSLSGNVTAGGNALGSSITVSGSSTINGNVSTPGMLSISSSRVGASTANTASAGRANLSSGTVGGSLWVTNDTTLSQSSIGKNLTTKTLSTTGSTVGGTTTVTASGPGASPYAAPVMPTAPNWIDYAYSPSTWSGYTVVTLGSTCDYNALNNALTTIGSNDGVIDARACTGAVDPGSYQTLTLKGNLAIIGNSFNLGGSASFAASSAEKLWLVMPDTTADNQPTCPSGASFTMNGAFSISSNISTLIYTPCTMDLTSSNTLYGQVWAGKVSLTGAGKMYFVPVGLPGYDMALGSAITSTTTTTAALTSRYTGS